MKQEEEARRRKAAAGFTLVEVLVVILILAALAGLIAPALRLARRRADKHFTKQEITRLSLAIENFADQDPFGDWPPARLAQLGVGPSNEINEPTESLVLCLSTQRGEGPYFQFDLERLVNLDGDEVDEDVLKRKLRTPFEGGRLFEYADLWGNPYVYIPAEAYGAALNYVDAEGRPFTAKLEKDPRKGVFPAPLKFVIWSLGPDGVNQNGNGDDICSWR